MGSVGHAVFVTTLEGKRELCMHATLRVPQDRRRALRAFCSVSSCCATTLSTSTSIRLNSSKQAQAPCIARQCQW